MSQILEFEVVVHDWEIQDLPNKLGTETEARMLCKQKGMPMIGVFYPRLDPGYIYTTTYYPEYSKTVYKWKSK